MITLAVPTIAASKSLPRTRASRRVLVSQPILPLLERFETPSAHSGKRLKARQFGHVQTLQPIIDESQRFLTLFRAYDQQQFRWLFSGFFRHALLQPK